VEGEKMTNIPLKSFITLVYDRAKLLIPVSSLVELEVKASGTSLHYKDEHVSVVMPVEVINLSIDMKSSSKFLIMDCTIIGENIHVNAESIVTEMKLQEIVINEFSIKCHDENPTISKKENVVSIKVGEF
jgi:hypothetical protein